MELCPHCLGLGKRHIPFYVMCIDMGHNKICQFCDGCGYAKEEERINGG